MSLQRRASPWAVAIVLALVVAGGIAWLRSPARHRPTTLPAGGRIVRERLSPDGVYFLHVEAREEAFAAWTRSMGMEEDADPDEPGTRAWSGPAVGGCLPVAVYFPSAEYGVWGAGCR